MPPKKKSPARKKKQTVVEQVMNERNLIVAPIEVPSTAPIVHSSEFGQVRIEGEVTPKKLALAKQFDSIFQQATGEIMDLAAFVPDERVLGLVKNGGVTEEMVREMKAAPAWTFFDIGGEKLMKTPDNKLDTVRNYCFRLERAVIDQVKLRTSETAKMQQETQALQTRIKNFEFSEKSLVESNNNLRKRLDRQAETIHVLKTKNPTFFYRLVLELGPLYDRLKSAVIKLLS